MFTPSDESIVWQHIEHTRTNLATYLNTLDTEQWNQQSLCDDWLTRDVIAHLIIVYTYSLRGNWADILRSGLRINTFLKQTAIKHGQNDPGELLAQFQDMINKRNKPSSISVLNVLVDLLVHEQDIRVPLGHLKPMPLDSLQLIFSHWEPLNYNLGEKITGLHNRINSLEFVANDINIRKGKGLKVEGSAQSILLAILGRPSALKSLSGDGVVILKQRLN